MATKTHKEIFGIIKRTNGDSDKSYWQRIGTAFKNKDGSYQLLFDYLPTNPETGIQLRDPKPEEEARG